MGVSVSLILIAVGAILTWAVTATVSGIDIEVVGVILMVVGIAGLLLSLVFWSLYMMAPSGLQLFAVHNVRLEVWGYTIAPQWIQNINTACIVIGGQAFYNDIS